MLQFIWVLLYNYTSGLDDVPALPLPPGVGCTMESRFNYLTFCLFLLPCVNSVGEAWPVCIGGLGEERGLQELVKVNTLSAIKTCNLTSRKRYEEYPRLFLMYLVPLPPPPLGAAGIGFLLCPLYHVRVIANEPIACCYIAMPKSLEFQTIEENLKNILCFTSFKN